MVFVIDYFFWEFVYLRNVKIKKEFKTIFKMNLKHFLCLIFMISTFRQTNSSVIPQIQFIEDTNTLFIEENVPFIDNQTEYILQLFYVSSDFKQFNDVHLTKIELLNNLTSSFVNESNSNLLIYQNAFKQATMSPQALTNKTFLQESINILHRNWDWNSYSLNQSLSIVNAVLHDEYTRFEANIVDLRKNFFNQYFDTNFTIFLI